MAWQFADEKKLVVQQCDHRCSLSRIKYADDLSDDLNLIAMEFLAHVARRGMRYQHDLIARNKLRIHTRQTMRRHHVEQLALVKADIFRRQNLVQELVHNQTTAGWSDRSGIGRSEERRVGKECRSRWSSY